MKKLFVMAVIASMAAAGGARAEAPSPIAMRQAGMDLMQGTYSGLLAMVAAKTDVTKMQQPARAMARYMGVHTELFPPGSDKGKTKALPEIWSDNAGFRKDAEGFIAAADKLGELAKAGDTEQAVAQVKVVGDACVSCHKTYRAR